MRRRSPAQQPAAPQRAGQLGPAVRGSNLKQGTTNPVVAAIFAATPNSDTREAMLLGSDLESSWNPQAVGDQGTSFGPFQIHLPAHPGVSAAEAEDPAWAARYMLPAYTAGTAAQGSLWSSDPERAAEQAAVAAERPAEPYYTSDGVAAVNADWTMVGEAMRGQPITQPPGPGGVTTTSWWDPASWVSSLVSGLVSGLEHDLLDIAAYGGVLLVGAVLVAAGLVKAASGSTRTVTQSMPAVPPAAAAAAPEAMAL